MIHLRAAGPADARPMADLLAEIINRGGTTALVKPVTPTDLAAWMTSQPGRSFWTLAEDDDGALLGFQWIEAKAGLPPEAADISTFVRVGSTGLGVGTALFAHTRDGAASLGYRWINANIRADNFGGLAYYQSRGFEAYGRANGVVLDDGLVVDKVLMRFDLA